MTPGTISPEDQARARAREYFAAQRHAGARRAVRERIAAAFAALDAVLAEVPAAQASRARHPGRVVGAGDRRSSARDAPARGRRAALRAGRASGRPASRSRPRCSRRRRACGRGRGSLDELRRVHRERPGDARRGAGRLRHRRCAVPIVMVVNVPGRTACVRAAALGGGPRLEGLRDRLAPARHRPPEAGAGRCWRPARRPERAPRSVPDPVLGVRDRRPATPRSRRISAATSARRYRRCRLMPWR